MTTKRWTAIIVMLAAMPCAALAGPAETGADAIKPAATIDEIEDQMARHPELDRPVLADEKTWIERSPQLRHMRRGRSHEEAMKSDPIYREAVNMLLENRRSFAEWAGDRRQFRQALNQRLNQMLDKARREYKKNKQHVINSFARSMKLGEMLRRSHKEAGIVNDWRFFDPTDITDSLYYNKISDVERNARKFARDMVERWIPYSKLVQKRLNIVRSGQLAHASRGDIEIVRSALEAYDASMDASLHEIRLAIKSVTDVTDECDNISQDDLKWRECQIYRASHDYAFMKKKRAAAAKILMPYL